MENRILVVLESPNSSKGELSDTAIDRLNTCKNPHVSFVKEYLQKKEILNANFLPFAFSSNTVEDTVKRNYCR